MQSNFKRSAFGPEFFKRLGIYGILTLVLGSLQCAFFPLLDFCPQTPDILLAMLVAIALLDSLKSAAVCAVACGFFIDSIGAAGFALFPLVYFAAVCAVGCFAAKVMKGFPAFLILLIPALVCRAVSTYLCMALNFRELPSASMILWTVLPEALCSFVVAIPIYFLVKLCTIPLQSHSRFTF